MFEREIIKTKQYKDEVVKQIIRTKIDTVQETKFKEEIEPFILQSEEWYTLSDDYKNFSPIHHLSIERIRLGWENVSLRKIGKDIEIEAVGFEHVIPYKDFIAMMDEVNAETVPEPRFKEYDEVQWVFSARTYSYIFFGENNILPYTLFSKRDSNKKTFGAAITFNGRPATVFAHIRLEAEKGPDNHKQNVLRLNGYVHDNATGAWAELTPLDTVRHVPELKNIAKYIGMGTCPVDFLGQVLTASVGYPDGLKDVHHLLQYGLLHESTPEKTFSAKAILNRLNRHILPDFQREVEALGLNYYLPPVKHQKKEE